VLKHITLNQIEEIIRAAKDLNAKHPPSELGISASDITREDIEAYDSDQGPLTELVAALSHDARAELTGLMWIGRDFDGDFSEAVQQAYKQSDPGDVAYIVEKSPALPTYLRNGLKKIGVV
jgi:hypothetical protein